MTEQQILEAAHRIYSGDTDYPGATEEDYLLRRGFGCDAIESWASFNNVKWRELFSTLSAATTGDKTTVALQAEYDCPSDFVFISSFVLINGVYYTYRDNNQVMNEQRKNSNEQFFFITGNESTGYKLNINPAPDTAGLTISYSYYKKPSLLTATTSVPEMQKPYYIIYYILARLHEQDLRNDLVMFYEDKAKELLDTMCINNELVPTNHPYDIDDMGFSVNGNAFGR